MGTHYMSHLSISGGGGYKYTPKFLCYASLSARAMGLKISHVVEF